jgi:hypothetical protein
LGYVDYDPSGNGRMYISIESMGLPKASVYLIVDLDGTSSGQIKLRSYTYYSTSHSEVDEIIAALNDPSHCS